MKFRPFRLATPTALGIVQAQTEAIPSESATPRTSTANGEAVPHYRFRGVSQSCHWPAFQGGSDDLHANVFCLGNWRSSRSAKPHNHCAGVDVDVYEGVVVSSNADSNYYQQSIRSGLRFRMYYLTRQCSVDAF